MSKQTFVSFFFVRFLEILEHVKVFHSGKLFGKFLKNCATQMGNILKKAWWNLCESESNYGPRRSLKAVAKESSKFFSVKLVTCHFTANRCCETFPDCCETFPDRCETFPVCCESFPICNQTFSVNDNGHDKLKGWVRGIS